MNTVGTRRWAAGLCLLLALSGCSSGDDDAASAPDTEASGPTTTVADRPDVPAAEVEGPIDGEAITHMPAQYAEEADFVEEEYFVSGEATSYRPDGELGADGGWSVVPDATAPYRTRVLVRRPADLDDFNGTVVVEWFNVTAGADADPDFGMLHSVLLAEGYAYVGVSAQQVGVEGAGGALIDVPGIPAGALQPLTTADPERYGSLSHPGDAWSYDIYAQVAAAVRGGDLLEGTTPERVLAIGESQSAARMVTFINAVQPLTEAFDGFLVHSRGGGGAGFDDAALTADQDAVAIRTDLDAPVLQFETETDVIQLGFLPARQPDSETVATWEVAGTAHADQSMLDYGTEGSDLDISLDDICGSINAGPQSQVVRAAFLALDQWVTDGTPPPTSPVLETTGTTLRRDDLGNVLGGIRTPPVDAPIAAYSGQNTADSVICQLFGETIPFTRQQLADLYPTESDYVDAVTASAEAAVDAGFLLPDDADAFIAAAESAGIPG